MLAEEEWVESFAPIGRNPLEYVVTYRTWASESFYFQSY